jgi:beta,beta-carotene 9',10'-dioxygenase
MCVNTYVLKKEKDERIMTDQYIAGFSSLTEEITCDHLPVTGAMPTWLAGSLFRNGPAQFEVGEQKYRHWFDGLAMLHRFTFQAGEVSYANAFVQSPAYLAAKETGTISYRQFATDPCRALFKRVASSYFPDDIGANTNVSISKLGERFVALTEQPFLIEFDPKTLETINFIRYEDQVPGQQSTPHPHYDPQRRAAINSMINYGQKNSYTIYMTLDETNTRVQLGSVPTEVPAYIHSFSITEHYVVLVEYPLVIRMSPTLPRRALFNYFHWEPERGTHFYILRKDDGKIVKTLVGPAFFSFHHANAFERDNEIVLDMETTQDASIMDQLLLDRLRDPHEELDFGVMTRFHLPFSDAELSSEVLSDERMEFPRINYEHCNGKDYQFVYGAGQHKEHPHDFFNDLVKIDVRARTAQIWYEEGCHPGEPVFVASPGATKEDEGVILSVVLDIKRGHSFLLVLDAASFTELARAEVPHIIPFGFHGAYSK